MRIYITTRNRVTIEIKSILLSKTSRFYPWMNIEWATPILFVILNDCFIDSENWFRIEFVFFHLQAKQFLLPSYHRLHWGSFLHGTTNPRLLERFEEYSEEIEWFLWIVCTDQVNNETTLWVLLFYRDSAILVTSEEAANAHFGFFDFRFVSIVRPIQYEPILTQLIKKNTRERSFRRSCWYCSTSGNSIS